MKMDISLIESFSRHLKSQGRSQATIESYSRDARQFVDFINNSGQIDELYDPQTLVNFQNHLTEVKEASANTLRRLTISVRQFFRFISNEEDISHSPFDFVAIPEREEGIPEESELIRISQLIEKAVASNDSVITARNAAIVCLLGLEGLKTSELIEIKWGQFFDHREGLSTLQMEGNRKRVIELDANTTTALRNYRKFHDRLESGIQVPINRQHVFKAF